MAIKFLPDDYSQKSLKQLQEMHSKVKGAITGLLVICGLALALGLWLTDWMIYASALPALVVLALNNLILKDLLREIEKKKHEG